MLTPIARWDVVPFQRITGLFKVGVVAFSKTGIASVDFSFNGGATVAATLMKPNDRTGVWEYWATLDPSLHADGDITLDATVVGVDGGTNVLPQITVSNNSGGSLNAFEAWVAPAGGSDGTGTVGDSGLPYATIGRAAIDLDAAGGGSLAGATIYIEQGVIEFDNGGVWTLLRSGSDWLTVRPAAGGDKTNTRIYGRANSSTLGDVRFVDLTLHHKAGEGTLFDPVSGTGRRAWISGCDCVGDSRFEGNEGNGGSLSQILRNYGSYYTDTNITEIARGLSNALLVRNCNLLNIGDDAASNVLLLINCSVDNIDPGDSSGGPGTGGTGWHSDAIQMHGGADWADRIYFNVRMTNLKYQGIMIDAQAAVAQSRIAFVNCLFERVDPTQLDYITYWPGAPVLGGAGMLFQHSVDHLIMWHNTWIYTGSIGGFGEQAFYDKSPYASPLVIQDTSIVGNNFVKLLSNDASRVSLIDVDLSGNNHVSSGVGAIYAIDTNGTVGNAGLDVNGRPTAGSPLLDRVAIRVPIDLDGRVRSQVTAAGAYAGPDEAPGPTAPTNLTITVQ